MKIPRFAADDPIDLSLLHNEDAPAPNSDLNEQVQLMGGHEIAEAALTNVAMRATTDFYFAKYFFQATVDVDYEGDVALKLAVKHLRMSQLQQAVISIATTIDLLSSGGVGRTASLPHMIDNIVDRVEGDSADAVAARELGRTIKSSVNVDVHPELRYVRHMRNKWAGHASLDLRFDSWAGGDNSLNLRYLEAALVRVINAFYDFTELERMSDDLTEVMQSPTQQPRINAEGKESRSMRAEWRSVDVICGTIRDSARRQVDRLLELVVAGSKVA